MTVTRYMPTCWVDCLHCGLDLGKQESKYPGKRLYRLCERPGKEPTKCFESDNICEHVARAKAPAPRPAPVPVTPVVSGWEDY